ncbi:hypothetical protein [Streptomyces sp. NPDC014623]|uniref:hypothetical protein n=1 Tax=Streptomyces sp. NPDC014623 TaxID=3364875 RepID=UPI0036F7D81B
MPVRAILPRWTGGTNRAGRPGRASRSDRPVYSVGPVLARLAGSGRARLTRLPFRSVRARLPLRAGWTRRPRDRHRHLDPVGQVIDRSSWVWCRRGAALGLDLRAQSSYIPNQGAHRVSTPVSLRRDLPGALGFGVDPQPHQDHGPGQHSEHGGDGE